MKNLDIRLEVRGCLWGSLIAPILMYHNWKQPRLQTYEVTKNLVYLNFYLKSQDQTLMSIGEDVPPM